ncbi:polysaccharide biosynthesis tyrosine autokinase [Novosphingobium sp. BL-8A]|uniref:GumC family protein n=1 Tax=Novosphingobium sp. BL-8A TaxID=3127639 RepID=UPI003757D5FB
MNFPSSNLYVESIAADDKQNNSTHSSKDAMPIVRQYLRMAWRQRFIILGSVLVSLVLGLIVTLLMTPQYTATATIEISRETDRLTNFQGAERETSAADQEFYQTQYGLLQSRSLSERVAVQLQLVDSPDFFKMFGVDTGNAAFEQVQGHYTTSGRKLRERVAGDILRDHLNVAPTRLSRLADVQFTSPSASFSAKIANAWVDNYIQMNLERKVQATSYGRNMLRQQIGQAKERLDESQRQLVAYASEQRIINLPSEGGNSQRSIVADELATLNGALASATADRVQAETRYGVLTSSSSTSQALQNPTINTLRTRRAELAAQHEQLMTQFEPSYAPARAIKSQIAELDRSIASEEARVRNSIQVEYRQAQARESSLSKEVEHRKNDYLNLQNRSIQYNIYQQEVDTNRSLYDALLQRYKEIGVAGGVGVNNVAVVDSAEIPMRPSGPRMLLNLGVAFVVGFLVGAGLAFVREQLTEAIDDPEEVTSRLGLPLLGTVPKVATDRPEKELLDRKSELVEAYMAVQTSLAFATEHGVPRSLSITSTQPAEGKSTTSLALATMLARAQRKVILIDGDMRSPSVHLLGGVGHERGLSNYLSGEDDISSLTFEMPDFGLTAMSSGPLPPNAAELLTGRRLPLLISRLLESYDHVIIDAPPVMGLADAPLIASHVEGLVYAIESHGVRSSQVQGALARLATTNARIFGAVLTKFQVKRDGYGYGYGYGYGRDSRADAKRAQYEQ